MPPLLTSQPSSDPLQLTGSDSAIAMSDRTQSPDTTASLPEVVENWQGWAELENDPAIFSTLLREWGVPSVQVQEVFDLDGLFDETPESVFGLVFLSRWAAPEKDADHQLTAAPADLWFANQVSSYSCATVAIMNIVNNHPDISLGPELNVFRNQTKDMSPKERGIALDRFEYVRSKHNSFSTQIDKLTVDASLKDDALKYERKQKEAEKGASQGRKRKRRNVTMDSDYDENGFHFIAYAPALGSVWKMDGMETSPRKIGDFADGDGWLFTAIADLQAQMQCASTSNIEFSLLSLVRNTDAGDSSAEADDMRRAREDWGPFISHMIQLHAEKGDIRDLMK